MISRIVTKNGNKVFEIDGKPVAGKDRATAEKIQNLFLEEVRRQTGVTL